MMRPNTHTQGSALVITLLIAIVLFISVISITSSLSVSNRRTASDQGVALQAQYAAETGLTRSADSIDTAKQYMANLTIVPPSGTTDAATWVAQIKSELYEFCYGDGIGVPVSLASFPINTDGTPGVANGQWLCSPSQVKAVDKTQTPTQIADNRLKLVVNHIDLSKYGSAITTTAAAKEYWGGLVKGGSNWKSLGGSGGVTYRTRTAYDLSPSGIKIQNGGYIIQMGTADVNATGEVVSSSGQVIATRTVAQRRGTGAPLTISLSPPNFAYFAYFYNSHLLSNGSSNTISSTFTVNGPTFTNGRYNFAGGSPKLLGETASAGCDDGVQAGVCANKTMRYLLNGVNKTPAADEQWSGLSGVTPQFAYKKNAGGEQLCHPSGTSNQSSTQESVCPTGAADSLKTRDIHWNRAYIPMPDASTRHNFEKMVLGGVPQRDGSGNLVRDALGNVQMLSTSETSAGIFINQGQVSASTERIGFGWTEYTSRSAAIGAATGTAQVANRNTLQNTHVGKYANPRVTLSIVGGKQRIKVEADLIRGYAYVVKPNCVWGGGSGSGGGSVWSPSPKRPALAQELKEFMSAVLSFGSVAVAAWPSVTDCPTGSTFHSTRPYVGYWTYKDDQPGNEWDDAYYRLDKSGSGSTGTIPADRKTQTRVEIIYEVATNGTLSVVSSTALNSSTGGTTSTAMSWGTASSAKVDLTTATTKKTYSSYTVHDTSKPFNGLVYSDAKDNINSSDPAATWDDDYLQVSGDNTTAKDVASYARVTVATSEFMQINNDIEYESSPFTDTANTTPCSGTACPQNILGLYAMRDIDLSKGRWGWDGVSNSVADGSGLKLDGVIMSQGGSVKIPDSCGGGWGNEGTLQLRGSLIQNRLGATRCTTGNGYTSNFIYDNRMRNGFAPPAFPTATTGSWQAQVPNYNDNTTGFFRLSK